ncbi:MAG: L-threonylcarbamoyladenylate synthase [Bacteroidales bacterium]
MILEIYPSSPDERKLKELCICLENGGVIIYPTDTVFAIGCDITNKVAVEKLIKIKKILGSNNQKFTMFCKDISQMSEFCKPISSNVFREIKRRIPGAYTFILSSSKDVSKQLNLKRKEIGIRISRSQAVNMILDSYKKPLLTTSIFKTYDEEKYYFTNISEIPEELTHEVNIIVDTGEQCGIIPTSVIDFSSGCLEIIRKGLGEL